MSDKDLVKLEIIRSPQHYFSAQEKSLSARIEKISLTEEETQEIIKGHAGKFVRDKVLGFFKVGEIVSAILEWGESVDEDIKQAKKEFLIAQYLEKTDDNQNAINMLKKFITSPQGNTLFNKVLRVMDNSPPDLELVGHLSAALKTMSGSNFEALFEEHRYALSQIEMLTPQALTILSGHKSWPSFKLAGFASTGTKVTSDWLDEFSTFYCQSKGVSDSGKKNRIKHSINELLRNRMIEAHLNQGEGMIATCRVTSVGKTLLPYVLA